MVAERRYADEILTQVAAVKGALNQVTCVPLERQLKACFTQRIPAEERDDRLLRLASALSMVVNQS
jgi:DNA-binding FrmR family transcriptional regulator